MTDAEIVARIPLQIRLNLPCATSWSEPPFGGGRHTLVAWDVAGSELWIDRVDGSVTGIVNGRVHLVSPDLPALDDLSAAFRVATAGAVGASPRLRRKIERRLLRAVGRIDPALADPGTFWSWVAENLSEPLDPAVPTDRAVEAATGSGSPAVTSVPAQRATPGNRRRAGAPSDDQVPAQSRPESRHRHRSS